MAVLEVRRHTMRTKPGQHPSHEGVSLARSVGQGIGPFDHVASSHLPRAIETAIAMGMAVDDVIEDLGTSLSNDLFSLISWPRPIHEIAQIVSECDECWQYAQAQALLWRSVLRNGAEAALIISHGAIIELGALGMVPNTDHQTWGNAIGYCEGFRFTIHGNEINCEVLRLPPEDQIIEN